MRLLTLKTVLVATDLNESDSAALRTGQMVAQAAGAELHVVHALHSGEAGEMLSKVYETMRSAKLDINEAKTHVVEGDASHAVNLVSDQIEADVIVLGPHRQRHPGATGLGSTALAVVTNASVPCMVVPRPLRLPLERVIVAVDASDTARGALAIAATWTSALRARESAGSPATAQTALTALHVRSSARDANGNSLGSPELDKQLERVHQEASSWGGISIESAVTVNPVPEVGIAEYAIDHRADLIVLGTRGLGTEPIGRLGSVSAAVMQRLEIPTLLVPPAVWTVYQTYDTNSL